MVNVLEHLSSSQGATLCQQPVTLSDGLHNSNQGIPDFRTNNAEKLLFANHADVNPELAVVLNESSVYSGYTDGTRIYMSMS